MFRLPTEGILLTKWSWSNYSRSDEDIVVQGSANSTPQQASCPVFGSDVHKLGSRHPPRFAKQPLFIISSTPLSQLIHNLNSHKNGDSTPRAQAL